MQAAASAAAADGVRVPAQEEQAPAQLKKVEDDDVDDDD